jgi:hypothetical protein
LRREDALLLESLRRSTLTLSGGHGATSCDPHLRTRLIELYRADPPMVWFEHLRPFISRNREDIASLYDRHRRLPNPLLDELEALIVLERLDAAPSQLAEAWPRPMIELERLAQNWAVSI